MTQPQVPLQFDSKEVCRFDDFVGGREVVDTLTRHQRLPFLTYLWGAPFSGKSFLLSALYDELQKASQKVVKLTAEHVLDQKLVDYLLTDVEFFLLEDVEQLSGDKVKETALFNFYNACHGNEGKEKKLLMTAECSQRAEQWQLPDLRSRLSSGLVLSLEVLRGEAAIKCITQLFARSGMPLDDAVINYLKTTQNTSLSNLYPLFKQLTIDTLKLKRKVTIPMVKQAFLNIEQSGT